MAKSIIMTIIVLILAVLRLTCNLYAPWLASILDGSIMLLVAYDLIVGDDEDDDNGLLNLI